MISLAQLYRREWQVKQYKAQWLSPLVLFLLIITLFPLAMGTEAKLLHHLGVPAVWIACLLSMVIGVDDLFRPEFDNGTLAQLVVARVSLPLWVLVRLSLHWLFSAGMITLLSVLAVPLFALSWAEVGLLMLSILVASPILLVFSAVATAILLAFSAVATALTLSLKNGAVLVPLLALPLQLPVLIFATGTLDLYSQGLNYLPTLALLLGGSILAVLFVPWVIAYILRMAWI